MKKLMMFAAAFAAIAASAAVTITDVAARQRWPWNNLVDVDFTIGGAAQGEAYYVDISATYDNGNRSLVAKTFENEPIAATGKNRIVWNLGADYPEFKADDLSVTVTVTPFSDSTPLYCVIDISGGTAAAKWPVRYTTAAPVFTVGNPDPCKTTELWLKRVKAGSNTAGRSQMTSYGSYKAHICVLTNDYYLGVFPVTQAQFSLMDEQSGRDLSQFTNAQYAATRPVDGVEFGTVRDITSWSSAGYDKTDAVKDGCIIAYLRQRTGLKTIDLPTEWQWEYASRAGATGQRYANATYRSGGRTPDESSEIYADKGLWPEEYGTSYVDRYDPNPWGFYGTIGNVWEWCANYYDASINASTETLTLTEPRGGVPVADGANPAYQRYRYHVARGGAWNNNNNYVYCHTRQTYDSWGSSAEAKYLNKGFRLCIPVRAFFGAE